MVLPIGRFDPIRMARLMVAATLALVALAGVRPADADEREPALPPFTVHPLRPVPRSALPDVAREKTPDPRADAVADAVCGSLRRLRTKAGAKDRMVGIKDGASAAYKSAPGDVRMHVRPEFGTPRQLRGPFARTAMKAASSTGDPQLDAAWDFLSANRELLQLDDPDGELRVESREVDSLGRTAIRFRQFYAGLPVWPAELIVHVDPTGEVDLLDGGYVRTPRNALLYPRISSGVALARARRSVGDGEVVEEPELILYVTESGLPRLAWRMRIDRSVVSHRSVVVDASTGDVLRDCEMVMPGAANGSGRDELGTTRSLKVWLNGSTYYMIDTSKSMYSTSSQPPSLDKIDGAIAILDFNHQDPDSSDSYYHVTTTNANSWGNPSAVSAASNLAKTYDYFLTRHGRNSVDGSGGNLFGVVRVGSNYRNAFWNGTAMYFGDGMPFASALDVVAHELTHGVVEHTANLEYQFQPGALNEAFADIFGESAEAWVKGSFDWLLGTDLGWIIRNMADPGAIEWDTGKPYPSKMSEYYSLAGNDDHGGVHINSSIINHAFYLLAAGMNGAIGNVDAERIFYRALSSHLTRNSQFMDARLACIASAEELFGSGSNQALKTAEAFALVEIGSAPTPDPVPDYPEVSGADCVLGLYYDADQDGYTMYRRELALGDDPVSGSLLFDSPPSVAKRPYVDGGGTIGVYVSVDEDAVFFDTSDGTTLPSDLPSSGIYVHSVAMAPDAAHFAIVVKDESGGDPTNEVYVIDIDTGEGEVYELSSPATNEGAVNTVLYADVMDFSADNRFLVYDALNEIAVSGSTSYLAWSIYALDFLTGNTFVITSPDPRMDIGNPSLSQTSDSFLTFEVTEDWSFTVYAADLDTGDVYQVGSSIDNYTLPTYNGDDTAIIYADDDSSTGTGTSLVSQPVLGRLVPSGGQTQVMWDGTAPTVYRRGTYTTPNSPPDGVINTPVEGVTIDQGGTVQFTATGSDPNGHYPLAYSWSFGGGAASSTLEDPGSVTFQTPGTYTATLTVSDSNGLADPTPHTRSVKVNAVAKPLSVTYVKGKVSFKGSYKDSLQITGYFQPEPGFVFAGQVFEIDVGGVQATFAMDWNGMGRSVYGSLKCVASLGYVGFKISLKKGSFQQHWTDEGILPAATRDVITFRTVVRVAGETFTGDSAWSYFGKPYSGGSIK